MIGKLKEILTYCKSKFMINKTMNKANNYTKHNQWQIN